MRISKALGLGMMVAVFLVAGCGQQAETAKTPAKKGSTKKADHAHGKGPNGGIILDLGKHHAEFTVDHDKKECTVFILGNDERTPTLVSAKDLTLTTRETKTKDGKIVPPMTIKLLPKDEVDGKSSKFVGTDPGLGHVADFAGTILGEIDGKPSQGEFKE